MYYVVRVDDYMSAVEFYLISLEDLELKEVSESKLEEMYEHDPEAMFLNIEYKNEITDELEINTVIPMPDYVDEIGVDDIQLNGSQNIEIDGETLDISCGEGYVKFGKSRFRIGDHLVEDCMILYLFKYKNYICMRLGLVLDYSDPYYVTAVYDRKNKKFIDFINVSEGQENLFHRVKPSEEYLFDKMMDNAFIEKLNIDYKEGLS